MTRKAIQLIILLSLPISSYSVPADTIKYVKEELDNYDTNFSKALWGSFPGDPKGKIKSHIDSGLSPIYDSYRELRKDITETQNNIASIKNDIQTQKNKIDLVTKHLLTVIDVIKTDKSLAKEYALKEKISVR